MCKILKVSSLLGLLAFCAAEGMQINASSESNATGKPGTGGKLEISRSSAFEIKEKEFELTNLNDGTVTNYQKDEILEQIIYKGLVGQLKFNDGRVEYFTGRNIPENWFKGNTSLESIVIPPTVTSIGCNAFEWCRQLKEVIFTEGSQLQIIGKKAFSETAIKEIAIPNSVETIKNSAFYWCRQLQEVILPEGSRLKGIEKFAFSETAIEKITIPNSVIIIGDFAFNDCDQLQEVIFEKGSHLQKIEEDAFSETAIKEITIPGTVKEIGSGAFDCNQLSKVVFLGNPGKINIAQDAFPENVKRVYSNDSEE